MKKTIREFFSGKKLVIPSYQRDYAWTQKNVDDLFNDIEESLQANDKHYFGTFILFQTGESPFSVVDGQQRLTTITMLLHALISVLNNVELQQEYKSTYISNLREGTKFCVLGANEDFFQKLMNGSPVTPETEGQERLQKGNKRIRDRVAALNKFGGQDLIGKWLKCIEKLDVLEFIESDEGKAIRMFQSINDRGMPLSKMDIIKSLLVYYSNRYLNGSLDSQIANKFGDIFRSFSKIKKIAKKVGYEVTHINRNDFTEDDILRYHYLSFNCSNLVMKNGDYWATAQAIVDNFLKPNLKDCSWDTQRLQEFIQNYVSDLLLFFQGLEFFINALQTDKQSYLLWVEQGLSATLYPLVIRLRLMGYEQETSIHDPRTLLQLIELVDMRVFKVGGFKREASIYDITTELSQGASVDSIAEKLLNYCNTNVSNSLMRSRLINEDIYKNPADRRILLHIEELIRQPPNLLNIGDLSAIKSGCSIEHILPQDHNDSFNVNDLGFVDDADYLLHRHRLGNLVLLESGINSTCLNHAIYEKMTAPNCYPKSTMNAVQHISATAITRGCPFFDKKTLNERSELMAEAIMERWWV